MKQARIERLGDAALLLRFGETMDVQVNTRVHAWTAALGAQAPAWLVEITPAYASLALHVDTSRIGGADPLGIAEQWLARCLDELSPSAQRAAPRRVEIPVCYGGKHGPDLTELAAHAKLSTDAAIARHVGGEYTVAMLGFAPGFPYLLGLDPALTMPRRETPRTRVPTGSVGIGGAQTGIYPQAGPGGWRLIGRTPLRLFDLNRKPPSLLHAGDRVRFVAITSEALDAMDEAAS